jgi:hypothetical protein
MLYGDCDFAQKMKSVLNAFVKRTIFRAERKSRQKNEKFKKIKRYALVGTAAGLGGALIGLTGGLAAPAIAAGIGMFTSGALAGLATVRFSNSSLNSNH